jgi:hypothetical protein
LVSLGVLVAGVVHHHQQAVAAHLDKDLRAGVGVVLVMAVAIAGRMAVSQAAAVAQAALGEPCQGRLLDVAVLGAPPQSLGRL